MEDIDTAIVRVIQEPVKDKHMLMILIHEGAIMDEKLKIGGKLASMVKRYKAELQAVLGKAEKVEKEQWLYIRPNMHIE